MSEAKNQLVKNEKSLRRFLVTGIKRIEDVLPPHYKQHARYFVDRAVLAIAKSDNRDLLCECTEISFMTTIVEAATYGLAVDGKLAYPIPFKNNKTECYEVKLMLDYKGIVAVARRQRIIVDAYSQDVREKDKFDCYEENGEQRYKFRKAKGDRGDVIGAFAVAKLPGGGYRFEHMDLAELRKVQASSKSPNSPAWKNWAPRMYAKAPLKRVLNTFQDNPILGAIIDFDNREFDMDKVIDSVAVSPARSQSMDSLAESLSQGRIESVPESRDLGQEMESGKPTEEEMAHQIAEERRLAKEQGYEE